MSADYGYAGKILRIDLSAKTISEYPWHAQERAQILGGKLLAAQILCRHLTGKERAFSQDNWVVIATGPLTGTGAPGSVRFDIAALSPKDHLPTFSNCGGDLGVWLKRAGFDALILTGRSQKPCWLEIRESQVLFHDAAPLWGTGTAACQEKLAALLGTHAFGKLCIGPAGENLVTFASVVGDGHSAGRAGIGAVLGWKQVKAITVSGHKAIRLFAPEAAAAWNRKWHGQLQALSQSDPSNSSVCTGCPLRCSRQFHTEEETLLNDLGLDAIAAREAAAQAAQELPLHKRYKNMALHPCTDETPAKNASCPKGKSGKRKGKSFGAIAKAFRLSAGDPETNSFCRSLTEAVSAAGQCVFTLNGLEDSTDGKPALPVLNMLALVTGLDWDLEAFLQIGSRFTALERRLRDILQ